MKNYIFVLEHLSYVIECFCIEATGDGKSELHNLKEKLLKDSNFKIKKGVAIANKFEQALNSGDNKVVASTISSVSRNLWKETMKKLNEHTF